MALQQQILSPSEELELLKKIYGDKALPEIYFSLVSAFNVIQNRAQILLSLATICLTITGFSGPKIAQSSALSKYSIGLGILFVLISILTALAGPLQIRWITQFYLENIDHTLEELISRRNLKTKQYHLSMAFLGVGLSFYVISVANFLFQTS
jgi:hypothetical protein